MCSILNAPVCHWLVTPAEGTARKIEDFGKYIKATKNEVFISDIIVILTHFFPMYLFDPPEKSESQRFSDVFKGIKREYWEEMGC